MTAAAGEPPSLPPQPTSLRELTSIFLRLGATAFGGPAAHIALFREEFVVRRGWLTSQAFLDLLSAANLLPGPSSTEVALGVGRERAGTRGMLVAGISFITPAALMVLAVAVIYQRLGAFAATEWALSGIQAVVIVVIIRAALALAPTALPAAAEWLIAVGGCLLGLLGVHPVLILGSAALVMLVSRRMMAPEHLSLTVAWRPPVLKLPGAAAAATVAGTGLVPLFLVFLGVGALTFGSGYLLLAFLREAFVLPGLITDKQLLDAVAVGQLTPGPLFTTATFIGYLLEGIPGAVVGTVGIFLPAFVFVALAHPFLPRMRASATLGAAMDGVNAASIGLLLAVAVELARGVFAGLPGLLIAFGTAVLAWRYRVGTVWLLLVGGVCGVAAGAAGWS